MRTKPLSETTFYLTILAIWAVFMPVLCAQRTISYAFLVANDDVHVLCTGRSGCNGDCFGKLVVCPSAKIYCLPIVIGGPVLFAEDTPTLEPDLPYLGLVQTEEPIVPHHYTRPPLPPPILGASPTFA